MPKTTAAICTTLAAALLAAAAAAPAATRYPDCPARKGTIAKHNIGRVWHSGPSLFACTTVYAQAPKTRRLGPWKAGVKVAFDGVNVVWTVPLRRNGVRSDRVWAASADDGKRWLTGKLLVPAAGDEPEREARIQSLVQEDRGAAWVTRTGEVVFALQSPDSTPAAESGVSSLPEPDGSRLLVGTFTATTPAALASTLALSIEPGEGDECGGTNPYRLRVSPDPAQPEVRVLWWGWWNRVGC